jgi:DNA helicase II / ATP-dependent DNA helicase PcrA
MTSTTNATTTADAIDAILARLNEQQRTAATHGASPLLVVAGAGTGKTTMLAHRVAHLIATGTDPSRILLLTFTRRSAAEMLRRVDGILAELHAMHGRPGSGAARAAARRVVGGTFHAVATRLLRSHGKAIGLPPEFTILDRGDAQDLIGAIRAELELGEQGTRFPMKGTCLDVYSRCVNEQAKLGRVLAESFPWLLEHGHGLKKLFETYVDRKEAQAIVDYDDLLLFWDALVADPQAGPVLRGRFDHVLVDEYQDTNTLQANILKHLRPDGEGLTAVGDDAQSIYSFRAATVRNILDFPQHYPGTTVVPLERNYRSTQPILDATNAVIAGARERHVKHLWTDRTAGPRPQLVDCTDETEQTEWVVDRLLELRETGLLLRQQAVLFRASHHSLALEVELARREIPFHKFGGLKFVETAHVKDLMAYLKLAENPRDSVAGLRVLRLLPGIGAKRAGQLVAALDGTGTQPFAAWREAKPPAATATLWPEFVELMESLARSGARENALQADVHRVRSFYGPLCEQQYDYAAARLRDLEQLEVVASRFPDRRTFVADLVLDPPSSTQDFAADPHLDEDYVVLSTIHSAKGLEWDAVTVLHAADGNIPSDMATKNPEEIDEERRLFYVALTRAKTHLAVCYPQRYYFRHRGQSDTHGYAQLTRFLAPATLPLFDRRPAAMLDHANDEATTAESTTADVRSRLKDMWG